MQSICRIVYIGDGRWVNGRYFPVISDTPPAPKQLMEPSDGIVKGTAQQEGAHAENLERIYIVMDAVLI